MKRQLVWLVALTSSGPFGRIQDVLKPHKHLCGSALRFHEADVFTIYDWCENLNAPEDGFFFFLICCLFGLSTIENNLFWLH